MTKHSSSGMDPNLESMRLDKWLKSVRIFKKREDAALACELSRVKVNGQKAKASRVIRIGDQLEVKVQKKFRLLTVLQIPRRGLSAKDARDYYSEQTPEIPKETLELLKMQKEAESRDMRKYKGRPTKRERRDWEKFRGW